MKTYAIVRVGNEYVVQAGENSVLRISSRRRAEKLVTSASELWDLLAPPIVPECGAEPSITPATEPASDHR
ncbi:hypothetical protein [Bradyrhizobium sp.]|uniref:hypothetical protein n=1 Tax=Bradyrhizobium sp. TaxID=376 RepID=UPI0025C04F5A|nr:hypothetical protein [Bradyrhizobium sp.]